MNQPFTQLAKQLKTIWGQLGLNQRVTIVGATLAVLAGLAVLVMYSGRSSYALLYGNLDPSEASKVVAFLDESKIPYEVTGTGGTVKVPGDKVHSTRMALASKGIPSGEGVGFEIFDRSNFGISDFVQRANYLRAVQGELARTIGQVDSVENARVMIVMPENRLLINDKNKPTASVFLKVRTAGELPAQTVMAIRFLVANSVEGLQPKNVSVVDNLGNVLSDTLETDTAAGMTQTQLAVRKNLEQYLSRKVEDMLGLVLGPGQAVVRVAAELNFDSTTRTEERYDPESQVVRISTVTDENTDIINSTGNSGNPGVDINILGETNYLAGTAPQQQNNRTRKKVTNNQYEINRITENLVQAAGSVTRISAAVFVASRTEGTGAERKVVPRTPEQLEKLRKIVESALGIQDNPESGRNDEVTLEEFPFNDRQAEEITATLQKDQQLQFWLQIGQVLMYPALALVVLFFLWRVLKRAPDVDIPVGIPVGDGSQATGSGLNGPGRAGGPKVVTVDVLNQLIRENPQNMTHAIRSWMTRGETK